MAGLNDLIKQRNDLQYFLTSQQVNLSVYENSCVAWSNVNPLDPIMAAQECNKYNTLAKQLNFDIPAQIKILDEQIKAQQAFQAVQEEQRAKWLPWAIAGVIILIIGVTLIVIVRSKRKNKQVKQLQMAA